MALPFSWSGKALAGPFTEQRKIEYLLAAIESSDLIFVRENTEYSGKDAKAHLQHKLDVAGSHVVTAEDFIEKIASQSSLTGNPYYVQFNDGTREEAGKWLRDKLADLK